MVNFPKMIAHLDLSGNKLSKQIVGLLTEWVNGAVPGVLVKLNLADTECGHR